MSFIDFIHILKCLQNYESLSGIFINTLSDEASGVVSLAEKAPSLIARSNVIIEASKSFLKDKNMLLWIEKFYHSLISHR